ncbi:MAG: heparin lyase I family protein [Elainellaceae cyanobacterium]
MKKIKNLLLLCLSALVLISIIAVYNATQSETSYHTFNDWRKECKFDYSCAISPAPGSEDQAIRFEWRREDHDGSRSSKSAEYKTKDYTRSRAFRQTREAWISFKVYFSSETLNADSQAMILTQYHDIPDLHLGEDWRHPISSLSYVNGKLKYSYRGDANLVTREEDGERLYTQPSQTFSLGDMQMDQWHRFVYHHKFDITGKGILEVWHNGKQYSNSNIVLGYNDQKGPYWKFGAYYYDGWSDYSTRVVYFSDVKVILGKASYAEILSLS